MAGVNIADGINRFNRNAEMYNKYINRFIDDPNYLVLCEALESRNVKAAFMAAHALKGVAENLSMIKLR